MGAAQLKWIHDTNADQRYVDLWNNASLATRAKLLKAASRDPYQKHLSWEALHELVRADVTFAIQRQEKKDQECKASVNTEAEKRKSINHQIAADDPRLWWNKDRV